MTSVIADGRNGRHQVKLVDRGAMVGEEEKDREENSCEAHAEEGVA